MWVVYRKLVHCLYLASARDRKKKFTKYSILLITQALNWYVTVFILWRVWFHCLGTWMLLVVYVLCNKQWKSIFLTVDIISRLWLYTHWRLLRGVWKPNTVIRNLPDIYALDLFYMLYHSMIYYLPGRWPQVGRREYSFYISWYVSIITVNQP